MIKHAWALCRLALPFAMSAAALPIAAAATAYAQEGNDGGSIGGSISAQDGSMPESRPEGAAGRRQHVPRSSPLRHAAARVPRSAPATRRAAEARIGGGVARFDGAWNVAISSSCASGNAQVLISGGRISGQGVSGIVSPSGSVHTVGSSEGMATTSSGHLSVSSGAGIVRRADGCAGSWSAYRM